MTCEHLRVGRSSLALLVNSVQVNAGFLRCGREGTRRRPFLVLAVESAHHVRDEQPLAVAEQLRPGRLLHPRRPRPREPRVPATERVHRRHARGRREQPEVEQALRLGVARGDVLRVPSEVAFEACCCEVGELCGVDGAPLLACDATACSQFSCGVRWTRQAGQSRQSVMLHAELQANAIRSCRLGTGPTICTNHNVHMLRASACGARRACND
jgi:hypothetical protein